MDIAIINQKVTILKTLHSKNIAGFMLAEVVIATALTVLIVTSVLVAMVRSTALCYATAQHYAAYSLCRETIEQMRGANYGMVSSNNFPSTNMFLTHLGGTSRIPLWCTRYCTNAPGSTNGVVELVSPPRKRVTVAVAWSYRGRNQLESMTGYIYLK